MKILFDRALLALNVAEENDTDAADVEVHESMTLLAGQLQQTFLSFEPIHDFRLARDAYRDHSDIDECRRTVKHWQAALAARMESARMIGELLPRPVVEQAEPESRIDAALRIKKVYDDLAKDGVPPKQANEKILPLIEESGHTFDGIKGVRSTVSKYLSKSRSKNS